MVHRVALGTAILGLLSSGCEKKNEANEAAGETKPGATRAKADESAPAPARIDRALDLQLPVSKHEYSERPKYPLLVTASEVRTGAVGADWSHTGKGKPLADDQVFAWIDKKPFRGHIHLKKTSSDPALAKKAALEQARKGGLAEALKRQRARPAPHWEAAKLRTVPADAAYFARNPFEQRVYGPSSSYAPTLIMDRRLPGARLAGLLAHLCIYGGRLAIETPDKRLHRHRVLLGTLVSSGCKTQKRYRPSSANDYVGGTHAIAIEVGLNRLRVSDGKRAFAQVATEQLAKHLRPRGRYRVLVAIASGGRVGDLVALLDELDRLGLRHVHVGKDAATVRAAAGERNMLMARLNAGRGDEHATESRSIVRIGKVESNVDAAVEVVRTALGRDIQTLRHCHDLALQAKPGAKARLRTSFKLDETWYTPYEIHVVGGDEPLNKCTKWFFATRSVDGGGRKGKGTATVEVQIDFVLAK
jgi:hypothetical protein